MQVLLLLKKEKHISLKGREVLKKLALKLIIRALHCKLYSKSEFNKYIHDRSLNSETKVLLLITTSDKQLQTLL